MPKTRTIIDKSFALEQYLSPFDNGRLKSYEDVADILGVSSTTIEKIGKQEHWVEKRQKLGEIWQKRIYENKQQTVRETKDRLFKIWWKTLTVLEHEVNTLDLKQQQSLKDNAVLKPYEYTQVTQSLKTTTNQLLILLGQPINIERAEVTKEEPEFHISEEEMEQVNRFLTDRTPYVESAYNKLISELPEYSDKIKNAFNDLL